jgi:hypothetical protein
METGSSAVFKSIIQLSGQPQDQVQGRVVDTMLWLYDQNGAIGHQTGILFDAANNQWPIRSSGTIFGTNGGLAAHGIDLSRTAFSGDALKSNGFSVDPTGRVQATGLTIDRGFVRIIPTTVSGLANIDPNPEDGDEGYVTDASSPEFNGPLRAGASAHTRVHYDGSSKSWRVG